MVHHSNSDTRVSGPYEHVQWAGRSSSGGNQCAPLMSTTEHTTVAGTVCNEQGNNLAPSHRVACCICAGQKGFARGFAIAENDGRIATKISKPDKSSQTIPMANLIFRSDLSFGLQCNSLAGASQQESNELFHQSKHEKNHECLFNIRTHTLRKSYVRRAAHTKGCRQRGVYVMYRQGPPGRHCAQDGTTLGTILLAQMPQEKEN